MLFLLVGIIISGCSEKQNKEPYCLSADDKALLRDGDIILRRGEGMLSSIIVRNLNDTVDASHCGIIIKRGDSLDVIHCLSSEVSETDGVQICSLDEFTNESVPGSISVVRCRKDSTNCLSESAEYYLNVGKQFDKQFDMNDSTKFFCSEMILRILNDRLGIDMITDNPQPKFSLFFNHDYFDVIFKNH